MSLARVAVEINEVMDEMQQASALPPPRVFISYAREDLAIARQLAAWLEANGFAVWWDCHIEAGAAFDERIERAIDEAFAVIAVWSDRSVRSDWVKWEALQASKRGKLIPVAVDVLDLADIRPPFNGLSTLRLSDEVRIIEELRRLHAAR